MKLSRLIKQSKLEKISIIMLIRKVKIISADDSEWGFDLSDKDLEKLKKFFNTDTIMLIEDENRAYNLYRKSKDLGTYIESNKGIPSDYYHSCSLQGMKFIWVNLYGGSSIVLCKTKDAIKLWLEGKD